MDIRSYLCREAHRITDSALPDFRRAADWRRLIATKRRQYMSMMNLQDLPPQQERPPLNVTVTGTLDREKYTVEKLYYESLPKLYVAANLYVPKGLTGKAPGVLYVCGHSATQKVHYQAHPRRFAELGFVALVVETVQLGEVRGYHHGCYREGWWHWYSRGYTPAGIELLNAIRGLDVLQARPEVDGGKLGVTGISGGGATSWWLAAGDERIGCAAPVCGTATLASHISDRTIDGHCDCMWWINNYEWDLADVGALIAPRPLMIASANRDGIFTIASIREVYQRLRGLYDMLGAPRNVTLVETPGGHSYHEQSRTAIFTWFLHHLMGKDVPPDQVGDIDEREQAQETEDALRVFVNGPLPDDRTLTIHDDYRPAPGPPEVETGPDVEKARAQLITDLKEHTFSHFPDPLPDVGVTIEYEDAEGGYGNRFGFTPEEGWRLFGQLRHGAQVKTPAPAVVSLALPADGRRTALDFAGQVPGARCRVAIHPRGTGETVWGQELQWHLRRSAAWTGRTIASMRVLDVLQALAAVRQLPQVDPEQVSLAARSEMCAVALYAALLDGKLQNAASSADGTGECLEMLNCLRYTDLPYVCGLLWPLEIVLSGETPGTYAWAEQLYQRLGAPGKLTRVAKVGEWRSE
jgi:dienelactone hydrolase